MAKIRREFKNVVYNYTDAEVKVREATSNDPWGPSGTLMSELAEYTYHIQAYTLVMGMLWKRLNDHGKNWRHVYKALVVLDYLVKNGSQRVVQQCKDNMFSIETLKDFQYIDKDGKDQGTLIREKAKNLSALLKDEDKLSDERSKASKTKGRTSGLSSSSVADNSSRSSRTPERSATQGKTASPSGRFEPDINQSKPSAKDEEDLQLQMALRMSKEQAEKDEELRKQEEESLRMALELSKQEAGEDDDKEEEEDAAGGGGAGEEDLLGLGDPWGKPPSYDAISTPQNPDDPWVPPVTNKNPKPNDTFGGKDPFSTSPPASTDPWNVSSSPPPANTAFGDDFGSNKPDPWSSFGTTTTTESSTIGTGGFSTEPTQNLPSLDIGLAPLPSTGITPASSDPYDFSAFSAPLDTAAVQTGDQKANKKVEESFLGSNAGLVNLDSLITPLPPPSSINPFGLPTTGGATPPTMKSSNPFEVNKGPAPTLQQLQIGAGFDPLPPPLLPSDPSANNTTFNPFS